MGHGAGQAETETDFDVGDFTLAEMLMELRRIRERNPVV